MRDIDPNTLAALGTGQVVPRDFVWLEPRDRSTGTIHPVGFWSDVGSVNAQVIDPQTDVAVTRTYRGAGDLVAVSPVALAMGLVVQEVTITLSQVTPDAQQAVRGYDVRRALVELHRGYLDPASGLLVAPALPWFTGEIDGAPITTPPEGEEGAITLKAKSHAQELTRTSAAKRSDADQRRRDPNDAFFQHAAVVGTWKVKWGR